MRRDNRIFSSEPIITGFCGRRNAGKQEILARKKKAVARFAGLCYCSREEKNKGGTAVNLQHLKYVVEVEKTGSITQAAQNLYMGQPNLSKAIKELEKNLGIVLFKRTSKGVLPTAQGEEFLRYAKSILDQVEQIENLYRLSGERPRFYISVARDGYIAYAFGRFLCRMEESQRPDIRFKETDSGGVIRDVAQRESDLGIIRCPAGQEDSLRSLLADQSIIVRPLRDFTYQVLFSQDHPLAKAAAFTPEDLHPYTEIFYGDGTVPGLPNLESVRREKPPAGKRIRIYERGSQFDLLCQVPGSYAWTAPMPSAILDRYQLVQRKCGDVRTKDLLICLEGYRPNPWEEAFLRELTQAWAQMVPPIREKKEKGGR